MTSSLRLPVIAGMAEAYQLLLRQRAEPPAYQPVGTTETHAGLEWTCIGYEGKKRLTVRPASMREVCEMSWQSVYRGILLRSRFSSECGGWVEARCRRTALGIQGIALEDVADAAAAAIELAEKIIKDSELQQELGFQAGDIT